jgi:tetratricopeptide (TPR) repeat protein
MGSQSFIAQELNDPLSIWAASHWIGHAFAYNCEFENALHHLERALQINEAVNIVWGVSIMKSCIGNTVYNLQGNVELAYQYTGEGIRLAEDSGDILSKGEAYSSYGIACYGKGFLDEAEANLLKGIDFCDRTNYFAMYMLASYYLGETYFEKAEYQKAQAYYKKAISLAERLRAMPSIININRIALARAKVMNKETDVDLISLSKYGALVKMKVLYDSMARYIGDILLNLNEQHISEGEEWIKKAIEAAKENGMIFGLGRAYAIYAELMIRKEDIPGAKEHFKKAIEIYTQCGATGWAQKAQEKLKSL